MADEGVRYYPPVAPEVPVADHTAAKIIANSDIAGSFTRGLAAFGQIAAASKRAQLESEQMATDAALKSRQLDIARENNLLDFKVGLKNVDAEQEYRRQEVSIHQQNADSLENYRKRMTEMNGDPSNPRGLAGRINLVRKVEETKSDFMKQANDYELFDPKPTNPVKYYANYQKLVSEYQYVTGIPEIKNALKQFKLTTEQHGVPLKFGRTYDEDKGEWVGGKVDTVPVGQIVEELSDPDRREEMTKLLESNELTVSNEMTKPLTDNRGWLQKWLHPEAGPKQTFKEETLAPSISRYAKMAAGVDFSRKQPRAFGKGGDAAINGNGNGELPTGVTQNQVDEASAAMAQEKSGSQETTRSKEELFPPTETEKVVAQAKRALAKGAPADAVKAMLESKGIDPNLLDQ